MQSFPKQDLPPDAILHATTNNKNSSALLHTTHDNRKNQLNNNNSSLTSTVMKSAASAVPSLDMHSFLVISLTLSAFVCSAAAFAFDRSYQKQKNDANRITLEKDMPEPNFHVVLQRIGKTVLRPGGKLTYFPTFSLRRIAVTISIITE